MSSAEAIDRPRALAVWRTPLFVALIVAAVALESWLSPAPAPIITAIGSMLGIIGLLMRRRLTGAILVVLFVSLAFVHELSTPAITTPVRIYWIDLLIGPLLVAGVLELIELGRLPRLGGHFLAIVAFSIAWTALGMIRGQDPLDAIGVFRRVALYPSIYLVTAAAFERRKLPLAALRWVVLLAAIAISLHTLYRLSVGEGYAHDYFEAAGGIDEGGVSRWTSYLEILAPVLAIGLVADDFMAAPTRGKRFLTSLAAAFFLFPVIASNYRSVWGAFLAGAVAWIVISGHRASAVMKRAGVVLLLAAVIGGGVYAIADEHGLPTQKFSAENLRRTTGWRTASWQRASRMVASSPLTGVGFGYHHVFRYQPHPGGPWATAHATVHNDALWILVDAGILGALLILGFHVRWLLSIASIARRIADERGRALTAAIIGAYATIMVIAMFQPVFSMPAIVRSVSTLMAFASGIRDREVG